jgi:hypothetical protein
MESIIEKGDGRYYEGEGMEVLPTATQRNPRIENINYR